MLHSVYDKLTGETRAGRIIRGISISDGSETDVVVDLGHVIIWGEDQVYYQKT